MTATVASETPTTGDQTMPKGITPRHARTCSKKKGGERCSCTPTYQAQAWAPGTGRRGATKTFPRISEAEDWLTEKTLEIRRGIFRPGRQVTIRVAFTELFDDMKAGIVRNRSRERYKPGTIREYERDAKNHILPAFGSAKPTDLRGSDVQRLIGRLVAEGKAGSTVQNNVMPLRVLYRRLRKLEELTVTPMDDLDLPARDGKRLLIVTPEEGAELIAAIPLTWERAVWAMALYAGLRAGEIQAVGGEEVDLATAVISVEWNWDRKEGRVRPKSKAGIREVPVAGVLRGFLLDHRLDGGRTAGLLFGRTAEHAFRTDTLQRRADRAWALANNARLIAVLKDAGVDVDPDLTFEETEALLLRARAEGREVAESKLLRRVTFHDFRHTYASTMIAAMSESPQGFNPKLLSTVMGHSTIAITIDRYGHLFPGDEQLAAGALDAFLERSNTAARKEAVSDG